MEPQTDNKPGVIRPWILITVIVLIIAAVGFFTWHYLQKNNALPLPTTTPTTTPVVTPTTTPKTTPSSVVSEATNTTTPSTTPTATPAATTNKFDGVVKYGYSTSSTLSPYYHQTCKTDVSFDYSATSKIVDNSPSSAFAMGLTIADSSSNKTFVHCLMMEPQTVDAYIEQIKSFNSSPSSIPERQTINGYEVLIFQSPTSKTATIINGSNITLTNVMEVRSDSASSADFSLILNSLKFK
jgi:hypothetical protein